MKIYRYNQFILERLGVPEGIVESATKLYAEMIIRFERCKQDETLLDDPKSPVEYNGRIPIEIKINQLRAAEVFFTFQIAPLRNPDTDLPMNVDVASWGVSVQPQEIGSGKFTYIPKSVSGDEFEIEPLELRASFMSNSVATFFDLTNLLKSTKDKSIGILAHELKHVYDKYMFGKEYFDEVIDYSVWANIRTGFDVVDEFIYNLYVISVAENLVRPSEMAGQIQTIGITKSEFKGFLENLRLYKELKEIKYWSYQNFREEIRKSVPELRTKIKGIPIDEPEESIIDFICETTMDSLTGEMDERMQKLVGIHNVANLLQGKIKPEDIERYERYIKQRTYKNCDDFFNYWQKRLNFEGEKMIKKISKLYDMCKDDDLNQLQSKISGRECIVNPKLHNQLVLSPSTDKIEKPLPIK